jgi:type IX secretion system PorP/SprF family membrane protein
MKSLFLLIFCSCVLTSALYAQQEANFTHYMHNTLAVNPAYAGTRNALTATALHRNQWVGFDGAPKTYTITVHAPVFRENIGLGLSLLNDEIGPLTTTGVFADFSYHVRMSPTAKLAFGLKAGLNHMRGNLSSLTLIDEQPDPLFSNDFESRFLPNFGFGMYYFTSNWYIGVSSPRLVANDFLNDLIYGSSKVFSEERHYFLILGTVLDVSSNLKFNPTALAKTTMGAPIVADFSAVFILNDKIEMGLMYRTGDAVGALLGYHITDQIRFGYSYDWSVANATNRYNGGSHEVILRYDFIFRERERRIISPRYF